MSPRALLIDGFDFFFYSKEEDRMHIHVEKGECDAKFWIEPSVDWCTIMDSRRRK